MAKNLNAKCKMCRRVGEKLFLKGDRCNSQKCAIVKRNYPPGVHGSKGRKRLSDFGNQLFEKQKAKWSYQMLEKQFRLTFASALKSKGSTGEVLFKMLERRFDNVIFRIGLADSRLQARQMISHNFFTVDNIKMNIPSYLVKPGDIIKIKKIKEQKKYFKDIENKLKKTEVPGWINVDKKTGEAKILHDPKTDDIKTNISTQMIVEFYSK
jgi:small subunit ribosomal protein S4